VLFDSWRRVLIVSAVAIGFVGCDGSVPSSTPALTDEFQALSKVAATAAGYSSDKVDLMGSSVRLRVDLSDSGLAVSDQSTREQVATIVVKAIEAQLASHAHLANVQAISIAIIHPAPVGQPTSNNWHIEDVVEFRKGPDLHFIIHSAS
jgi:hypothetical protein